MAIVPRKLVGGGVTYYVTFTHNRRTIWERAGSNKRAAESLEAERKREVKAGTYSLNSPRGSRLTVAGWFTFYFSVRDVRSVQHEIGLMENHLLSRPWLAGMLMADVDARVMMRLVDELRATGKLVAKSISTIMGVASQAFDRAVFEKVLDANPVKQLPAGTLKWKSKNHYRPYTREEAKRIMTDERGPLDLRVFAALAFYTGMREGEICARRWSDWDLTAEPLTSLRIDSQYEDQPLKTDDEEEVRPRQAPVHPELETILKAWRDEGFELVHLRKPTPEDRIVPHRKLGTHSKSSGYKAWRRLLEAVGVDNRSLHSTRATFISVARSNGADKDRVERVTHNSGGDIVDDYTTWDWFALCQAVAVFDLSIDRSRNRAFLELQRLDSNRGEAAGKRWNRRDLTGGDDPDGPSSRTGKLTWGTLFDARQRALLDLVAGDPERYAADMALVEGLQAVRSGGDAGPFLRKAAAALGYEAEPIAAGGSK